MMESINDDKSNTEKFYVGTAILNRTNRQEQNTMGMFINTVPLLMELDNQKSFLENLQTVADSCISLLRHQKYNYSDVLQMLRSKYQFQEKLYDVLLSYQNAKINSEFESFESEWYHCGMQAESLQIHIDDRDGEGVLKIHYDYQVKKFTEEEILKMHEHLLQLLSHGMEDGQQAAAKMNLLTEQEKNQLLYAFNDTCVEFAKEKCFHQLFTEQVEKTPEKTALIFEDQKYTFRQLDEMSNSLAHCLREKGVKPNEIIPIISKRSWHILVAMIAINKAGGAFMFVDPNYPEERIRYMLEDAQAKMMLSLDVSFDFGIIQIDLETFDYTYCTESIENVNTSEDYTYVIFTSGSTGKPKGLLIKHRNVANFCHRCKLNIYDEILKDNYAMFLSVTNVIFDVFITESFLPLTSGHTILLANDVQVMNPLELSKLCDKYKPELLETTPTKFKAYISNCESLEYLKSLKVIMLGGEAFPESLAEEIRRLTSARIFNMYGPAETTVWSTFELLDEKEITIGKPIANTQIYILDKFGNLVPTGAIGELCIAGDGVGGGYLNRPELTTEKFIPNPFGEGKLYKTGDLAYWRNDGKIIYVGRNDFQVKIRGLRIELGEIENAIDSVEGVGQAVVVVRKDENGRQLICAFYTEKSPVDPKAIRKNISSNLPRYMVPHIFTPIEELPLTASGKVNRKALPEVDLNHTEHLAEYEKPQTKLQKKMVEMVEEVLGESPIGISDDFFDLGGDSLAAIEFVSLAHNEGIYFTLQNVYDYPTMKELCEFIENGQRQHITFDEEDFSQIHQLLKEKAQNLSHVPEKTELGNILLAGATGFLGIHLLADYLENDKGTAYCLVRGADQELSKERFYGILNHYFGKKYHNDPRIVVVCADLQQDHFGLTAEQYDDLLKKTDTVINAAASVKHYGSYEYFYEVNTQTTKRLISFCMDSGAKLVHTSTLSVSGNSFADDFEGRASDCEQDFSETEFYIGQPLENVYARSKFEAERAVLDAMCHGLKAKIMRMGNLTNRVSDGIFQKNYESNAFLKRLKAILTLGILPDYLTKLYAEFTAIDEAAAAVMVIARHFEDDNPVFHINSHKVVYMDKLAQYFAEAGYPVKIVSAEKFTEILQKSAKQNETEFVLETFINDMDENDRLNYDSKIHVVNDFTVEYLKMLGFEWSEIGFDYVQQYIHYFENLGYLEK